MTVHDPSTERDPTCCRIRGRTYAPLVVPQLPAEVAFGILGRILAPKDDLEGRIELERVPAAEALQLLDRAAATAEAEIARADGGAAAVERPELERTATTARELAREVGRRDQDLWRVGVVLSGRGRTASGAGRNRSELKRRLSALGFRPRVPAFRASDALAPRDAVEPVGRPPGYWHTLHTDGVAALFPFVDESIVEPNGVLVGLLLDDASPVVLDRWLHASHSWGLFGTTGAGKSFTAALLAVRSAWREPELQIIVLDPLGEFADWARRLGGTVVRLGRSGAERINPLDPTTTGGDRLEKVARAGTLLRTLFPSLRDEEAAALDAALHRLYFTGPAVPVFSDLVRTVEQSAEPTGRLPALLRVFTEGSLSHLDGPTCTRLEGSPLVITLDEVPEDHLAFHLSYLLDAVHGILRRADRHRLVVLDESHLLVRHPAAADYLDRLVRVVRHYRAGLLLLSQHPEDFLQSHPGRSILRNLRATLLLRLNTLSEEVRGFFQLTAAEAEWLPRARLPREAGYAEGLLRFGGAHLPIAIVASTPEYRLLATHATSDRTGPPPGPDSTPRTASLSEQDGRVKQDVRAHGGPGPGPQSAS